MESDCIKDRFLNGIKPCLVVLAEAEKVEEITEEEDLETKSLLSPAVNGESEEKNQEKSKRKVRFNDRSLTQVLEFQPSDTSDSENEYEDSCNCTIM